MCSRGPVCQNQAILNRTEFTLDGSVHGLKRLAEEVAAFCRRTALGSDVEFDLNLAMEELFTNAVRHGGCGGMKDAVRVRLERVGDAVEAWFFDRGDEFDPAAARPPDVSAPLAERPAGGLGLHLVHQIMRDFNYQRSGEWNCITMRRPL